MDERALEEVIAHPVVARRAWPGRRPLRYRSDVQLPEVGPLVEVRWPAAWETMPGA